MRVMPSEINEVDEGTLPRALEPDSALMNCRHASRIGSFPKGTGSKSRFFDVIRVSRFLIGGSQTGRKD